MSDSLSEFRREARAWLQANAPESLRGKSASGPFSGYWGGRNPEPVAPDVLRWRDVALQKGWTAPDWPVVYGGGGLTVEQGAVIREEIQKLGLPWPVGGVGLAMIGPTLLEFGTDAQREEHLPKIVRGEIAWCQGYSEPNAGSDLASLQTAAVRDGDHFVINGQKIWTSHAAKSDWIFCLVRTRRTEVKQVGITFILIDMASAGVDVRPIELISGWSPFCETFFDNVRVPVANVVGEVDEGWKVAKALLNHERASIGKSIARAPGSGQKELVAFARRYQESGGETIVDPLLRDAIAANAMREAAFHTLQDRIAAHKEAGEILPEAMITKVVGSELKQERFELGMRILGSEGLGWEGDGFDDDALEWTRQWLRSRANSIEGGSTEVQLNIIAKRILGLPGA